MNCFNLKTNRPAGLALTSLQVGGKINSTRTGDNDERKKVNYWLAESSLYHDSIVARHC